MSRRGRGEGALFRRADGYYVGEIVVYHPVTKARSVKRVYGKTRDEARDKLETLKTKEAYGGRAGGETVGQFLTRWLETRIKPFRRIKTYDSYADCIRLYITPTLGTVPLAELDREKLELFFAGLEAAGKSIYVRRLVFATLRSALNWAVNTLEILQSSPIAKVARPPIPEPKSDNTWTAEQAQTFVRAIVDHPLRIYFDLSIQTGMRQAEILGLHWADVDLINHRVTVKQQLIESKGKIIGIGPPKSKKAKRSIELYPSTVAALRDHQRVLMGRGQRALEMVLPTPAGGYYHKALVIRAFHRLRERLGLPYIRPHDLRHTCATLLMGLGENPKVVQERLGHAHIGTTLGMYSHVQPTMQKAATDKLGALLTGEGET